jgi:hypothetical protein
MHGRWSVADEHAATAVAEQALNVLCPPKAADPAAHRVVLACAEGEWHTMPTRCAGELARFSNVNIVQLGGSIPADHLSRHLMARPPAALALSVTMPTNLISATRSIMAARSQGLPVVVGGAAWGEGQQRARRLGADLHLEDPRDLSQVLDNLADSVPVAEPPAIPAEALLLDSPAPRLLTTALDRQCAASSWMRSMSPFQRDQSLQDLRWLARYSAASVVCDDPAIVRELINWLLAMLVPRGVPATAIIDSCSYLADAVSHEAPAAAEVLQQQAARARAEVGAPR